MTNKKIKRLQSYANWKCMCMADKIRRIWGEDKEMRRYGTVESHPQKSTINRRTTA